MDENGKFKPMERSTLFQSRLTYNYGWLGTYAGTRCEWFNKKWLDCASQRGLARANIECADFKADLNECKDMTLSDKRWMRMQEERIKRGLPFQDPPPYDTMHYERFKTVVH
jgi:hypothetical protein